MNRTKQFIAFLLCIVILFTGLNLFTFSAKAATTTIDLTGLSSGAENSHDCSKYLATKYDSTQHWQECTVCGKLYGNKTPHNLTTNTIIELDSPVVPVKPDHTNTLTVKTNKKMQVILKQMESVIKKGKVSYTDNYNGFYYNFTLDSSLTLSDIPSGKYEVIVLNKDYETKEITLSDFVNTTYDGKYLIISDINSDNKGTLNITLKDFNKKQGYQSETNRNNFWRVP